VHTTLRRTVTAIVAAPALGLASATVSVADEPEPDVLAVPATSPELLVRDAAELPATSDLSPGTTVTEFGSGSYVVSTPDRPEDAPAARVGVGTTIYLYLSRTEQTVLMGGGGAGIVAMACISLGAAGCIGVSVAVGGATAWVATNGFCPKRLEIAVGRGYTCVS
jgi:hypothetical protein